MLRAVDLGLSIHPMGGFDPEKAKQTFSIPAPYEPVAMLALGYKGNSDDLPEDLLKRETAERVRKPLNEFAFKNIPKF